MSQSSSKSSSKGTNFISSKRVIGGYCLYNSRGDLGVVLVNDNVSDNINSDFINEIIDAMYRYGKKLGLYQQ